MPCSIACFLGIKMAMSNSSYHVLRYHPISLRARQKSAKNVFIVSAVNYRHEQKSLPKRYQSHAICSPFSLFWKVPVNAQHRAKWICTMSRAILYLQRTGCSWRALPGDFPKWRTVHSYFQRWTEPRESGISILEEALKKIRWQQHAASRGAMKQPLS